MAAKGSTEGAAVRRIHVLELRRKGKSYRNIARELGISYQQVSRDLKAALKELSKIEVEEAGHLRHLELSRLDAAMEAIADKVEAGDLFAIDRWVKLIERRCKILGIDAPVKQEQDITIHSHEDALDELE